MKGENIMEFKVGDRFRVVHPYGFLDFKKGKTGRVKFMRGTTLFAKMDNGSLLYTYEMRPEYYEKGIEKIDDNKGDNINHPSHYTDGKIEVIDFIEDKGLNFNKGNAVKYIARAGKKDPSKEIEDLKKAQWYINREIKRLEGLEK